MQFFIDTVNLTYIREIPNVEGERNKANNHNGND